MKNFVLTSLFLASVAIMIGCGSSGNSASQSNEKSVEAAPTIVLFGSNECIHCIQFKAKLDSVGLAYTFNDVDVSDEQVKIMLDLVKKAGFTGRIQFPVVYLNNEELLVAPEFIDVYNMVR